MAATKEAVTDTEVARALSAFLSAPDEVSTFEAMRRALEAARS